MRECGLAFTKHEIQYLSLSMDAKISEHHRIQSCPHHVHNERDGSPGVLTVDQNSMN
jgi:hypothetical protein